MPMLDVSFMVEDPMLSDTFHVRRRLDIVGPNGRVTAEGDTSLRDITGVVTQQDPSTLMRGEDGQTFPRRIFIATKAQLVAAAKAENGMPGRQPDEVTWNGIIYTVEQCYPYSRFGAGFYEAVLEYRGVVPPEQ